MGLKNNRDKFRSLSFGVIVCFLTFCNQAIHRKNSFWLPKNCELENYVKDEVVSIMPTSIDNSHQSNKVFYSQIGMESFKRLFGNSEKDNLSKDRRRRLF